MKIRTRVFRLLLSLAVVLAMMMSMITVVWGNYGDVYIEPGLITRCLCHDGIIHDINIYGLGTAEEPWRIETEEQLSVVSIAVNDFSYTFKDQYFSLENDISISNPMVPIGNGNGFVDGIMTNNYFSGEFDGNGHTIFMYTEDNNGAYYGTGLFGVVKGGVIKDLTVRGAHIHNGGDRTGAIVGALFSGTIENCKVEDSDISGAFSVGAIAGYAEDSTITGCSVNQVALMGDGQCGGLVGLLSANGTSPGSIVSGSSVKGMTITCTASGTAVMNRTRAFGGIAGAVEGNPITISNCKISDTEFKLNEGSAAVANRIRIGTFTGGSNKIAAFEIDPDITDVTGTDLTAENVTKPGGTQSVYRDHALINGITTQNKPSSIHNRSTSENVENRIVKKENTLTIKVSKKIYKRSKLKKKKTFKIGAAGARGKLTYTRNTAARKAKIKVSAKGKVTVPRKCRKGTYKITVKAAGNKNYKACKKIVTIKVK